MTIVFLPSNECAIHVMEELVRQNIVDSIYTVLPKALANTYNNSILPEFEKGHIDWDRARDAQYSEMPYYHELKPVDSEIIAAMSSFEGEAIKLFERNLSDYCSIEQRFIDYYEHIKYWNSFLKIMSIDFVIELGLTPHEPHNYVLYRLCQIRKIPFFFFVLFPFRRKTRVTLCHDYENENTELMKRIKELSVSLEDDIRLPNDLYDEFSSFSTNPSARRFPIRIRRIHRQERIQRMKRRGMLDKLHSIKGTAYSLYENIPSVWKMKRVFGKEFRRLMSFYSSNSVVPDLNCKYIYFPLQYQPEMTTCPLGGPFVHIYLAVEMLSAYIPDDVFIYVKEHPVIKDVLGTSREVKHYQRLMRMKNVILVDMDIDTIELSRNAIAVASVTGSVGYEAMYFHKPYLMFGYQIMRYAPNTFWIRSNEDCKRALNAIVSHKTDYSDKDIKAFLYACGEESRILEVEGASRVWACSENNIRVLTEMLSLEIGSSQSFTRVTQRDQRDYS